MYDTDWFDWCDENINGKEWYYADEPAGYFIYFKVEEDALAFKLRYDLSDNKSKVYFR